MNQAEFKKVKECMLDRIWNVFGEPRGAHDFEAFIAEYVNALARYNAEDLRNGTDQIFLTLRVKSWPTIKECIDATRKCANDRITEERKRQYAERAAAQEQATDDERGRWLRGMLRGPIGRVAAKNGWILGLHDFVREHGRLPSMAEQAVLVEAAEFRRQHATGDIDMGFAHNALLAIAQHMDRRNALLAKEVLGDE